MILKTERLELVPLLPYQLKLWVENIPKLEKDLNCSYQAEPMEGLFLEIVKGQLEKTEKYSSDYLWHSFWFLVRKSDRVVVGSADFKDIPNTDKMSKISGIGEHKLRELMDTGEIEFVQNGNRRLLCENAIWDWYNRNKVPVRVAREA